MRYYTLRHKKYAIIAQSTGERGEVMITVEQIKKKVADSKEEALQCLVEAIQSPSPSGRADFGNRWIKERAFSGEKTAKTESERRKIPPQACPKRSKSEFPRFSHSRFASSHFSRGDFSNRFCVIFLSLIPNGI